MLNIVICDDDENFIEIVKHYISLCMSEKIKLEYQLTTLNSIEELENHLKTNSTDIVFLDIMINEKNAMNWSIRNLHNTHTQLIFMTSYPQSAYNISESNCCYYLVKSRINAVNMQKALQRALQNTTQKSPDLKIIKSGQTNITVDMRDIVYVETANNNISIHLADGRDITVYSTLKEYAKTLPTNFLRCHKCYMVNMNYIKEYRQFKFILKDMTELPIPQKKFSKVIEAYKNYISI